MEASGEVDASGEAEPAVTWEEWDARKAREEEELCSVVRNIIRRLLINPVHSFYAAQRSKRTTATTRTHETVKSENAVVGEENARAAWRGGTSSVDRAIDRTQEAGVPQCH